MEPIDPGTFMKVYGGSSVDSGLSIQETSDRGYIITGFNIGWTFSYGAESGDILVMKLNQAGESQWTNVYGGSADDLGQSIQETRDGGYVLTGYTYSYGSGENDVLVMKLNQTGEAQWTKVYGGSADDYGLSIQETSDGGYVLIGQTYSYGAGNSDVLVMKLNQAGESQWTKIYGGSSYDWGYSMQETSDGGYVLTGGTESYGAGE